jgi:serine/threonine protein kinase
MPCLSDYQKQRRLGQGAHGDVYLVTKRGSNKKYALKQIEKQLLAH